jgi:uncharacterized phiE125 gp8 family phage protein
VGLSLITAPTFEPVTLAEVKAHLRVSTAEEDGLLAGYLLGARQFAEGHTRRRFATQTLDYTIDWRWPYLACEDYYVQRIELPVNPVQSVTSVTYVDTGGSPQTLALTSQYLTKFDETVSYIYPAYGVVWPDVRYQPNAITVRFVAGWTQATFPNDLRQAILTLVAHWYENRESVAVGNIVTETPFATEAMLSGYRVSRIL